MRILICDDERPARGELTFLLRQLAPEADLTEARSGREALALLAETPVDVAFVDVQMPGMSGLALAAAIMALPAGAPLVVFATAFDAHAVRAFEMSALDYLVKPISDERLARTMARIKQALAERAARQRWQTSLAHYLDGQRPADDRRLWAERDNGNLRLVPLTEVAYIEAQDKVLTLHTTSGEPLRLRATMRRLEESLADAGIIRVHKSFLVNVDCVAEIVPQFSGTALLRLSAPPTTEIPLSRQYGKLLRDRFGP